jgi:hypothetical protein
VSVFVPTLRNATTHWSRAQKEATNASKNVAQLKVQRHAAELHRLKHAARVDAVQRLRRAREYESVLKKEDYGAPLTTVAS